MIKINLLPVRVKKRKDNARQFVSVYFLSVVLLVAGAGSLWVSQGNRIRAAERQLRALEAEVAQYAQYDQMLKDLLKKKELIDRKISVISNLQKDRDMMVRLLAMLSVEVPSDRMWFNKLGQGGPTVNMDGVALNNETVAEFMRSLESSPFVEKGSVALTHSRRVMMSDRKLREFRLTFRYVPFSTVLERMAAEAAQPSQEQAK